MRRFIKVVFSWIIPYRIYIILHCNKQKIKGILTFPRRKRMEQKKIKNTVLDKSANCKLIRKNRDKIEKVLSLLQDERSKEIYRSELLSRKNLVNMMPPEFVEPIKNQYFDFNIIRLADNEIFIDGGAFDGATTQLFLKHSPASKLHLFEPDAHMYHVMLDRMKQFDNGNLNFYNVGLFDEKGEKKFFITNTGGSRIRNDGSEVISTMPLDELIDNATFIKMDIEGAEEKALIGSKNTISKCKPKLAIAIYHKTSDLWEIPLLIHSFGLHYKLYIRKYQGSHFLNEIVCYGVVE